MPLWATSESQHRCYPVDLPEALVAKLTIEIPDVVALRLEALSGISGKSVHDLAREGLESFAGSLASRRAILKSRRAAAKAAGTAYSLADLGWLEGYAGQTVDELLLFEGTDGVHSILFALEKAIDEKLKTAGPGQLSGVELTVLSTLALNLEVDNGGYDQFFRNSSRRFAPVIVNHLARIGCAEIADITQDALDALDLPKLSVPAIEAVMQIDSESRNRKLKRCDLAFYETAGVFERLFSYVKAHQDGIRI